jgi:DNA invertase Pin-like site-specific DNA recombinase
VSAALYNHSVTTTTEANGLRLLLPARKSRKGEGETSDYTRQTNAGVIARAERDGNKVIKVVEDTISSQSMPWERKNLRAWMNDSAKRAMWDALYVTETDRLARMDDEGFHKIETWLYEHGKRLITGEDVQFPPRHDGDRYMWLGLKRRARTYWEDTKAKHAATREVIKANGAAIGKPPFGYRVAGEKLHKSFVIDEVNGPLAKEAFTRIAQGRTATSVAEYLTEATGKLWRVKRVTDMIKRTSYLGSRDGHVYAALVTQGLWDSANAAMSRRSTATGGRKAVHAYSSVILCPCSAPLYHHQSTRNGKAVGVAHYRCSRGRRGIAGEARCEFGALDYTEANQAVNAYMSSDPNPEIVWMTSGGDAARQAELARIKAEMNLAVANGDMAKLGTLAPRYAEIDARPAEPIRTTPARTGRTIGEAWASGGLTDQRNMLGDLQVIVRQEANGTLTVWDDTPENDHQEAA